MMPFSTVQRIMENFKKETKLDGKSSNFGYNQKAIITSLKIFKKERKRLVEILLVLYKQNS